jgi:dGTPase
MMMDWNALMAAVRCPKEGEAVRRAEPEAFRSAFEADCDRIIFSTPFRRLARKTQVHPLALNDHIHNRLTHSLEVASIGRSLGRRLLDLLKRKGVVIERAGFGEDLLWAVQASCLAHDIGNPPFGHAGEFAIREWIKLHRHEVFEKAAVTDAGLRVDLEIFEGNAQGFRMGVRPDNPKSGFLRLTYPTLGAMIKYPWDSSDARAREKGKFNVFSTEKGHFERMCEELGTHKGGVAVRHPLSFLSEAADDICYRIIDLEDASEIDILEEEKVRKIFMDIAGVERDLPIAVLRGEAIKFLIDRVWEVFEGDYEAIMAGERTADLMDGLDPEMKKRLATIKGAYSDIFAHRTKVAIELGAYRTLGRIIEVLCASTLALSQKRRFADADYLAQRCLELAWGRKYAERNEGETYGWWLHQIMDFVSSLTDNYARQLSREIEGA